MLRFIKTWASPDANTVQIPCTPETMLRHRLTSLRAHELKCIRGDRELFDALSFELRAGELLQVEGPNGSGKTSLLRMLCGFSAPSAGELRWARSDGAEAQGHTPEDVAYLGHAHGVKGALTPEENLHVARRLGHARADVSSEVALHRVGLQGYEETHCQQLSAGQRRRVALARLLVTHTSLWVLDEPLTSLDTRGVRLVEQMLDDHLSTGGMAVVSTHQPISVNARNIVPITLGTTGRNHAGGL